MHLPVLLALHSPAAERVKSSPKQKLPKKNRTTTRCSYNRLVCNCCAYASTRSLLSIIVTHIEPQTHRTNKPLSKGGARLCSDTFCWHVTSGVSFEARNLLACTFWVKTKWWVLGKFWPRGFHTGALLGVCSGCDWLAMNKSPTA